jgi:ATP-dependent DNA helicase HFM1/MER3
MLSANSWIGQTFLAARLSSNPNYYRLDKASEHLSVKGHLEQICKTGITLLQETGLVSGENRLAPTEFGEAMARYYVRFETMKIFIGLPFKAKVSEIVWSLVRANPARKS